MKINTRTVFRIDDDGKMQIIEQDSYEYTGPVAQCFSKSKRVTTIEETSIQDIDTTTISLEDIDGTGVANVGGDVSILVSDSGAIDAGKEIALAGLDFGGDALERGFDFGENIFEGALNTIEGTVTKAFATTRSDTAQSFDKLIKFGAIAAAVIGFGFIVTRARA